MVKGKQKVAQREIYKLKTAHAPGTWHYNYVSTLLLNKKAPTAFTP
jgi:hypothetical protein